MTAKELYNKIMNILKAEAKVSEDIVAYRSSMYRESFLKRGECDETDDKWLEFSKEVTRQNELWRIIQIIAHLNEEIDL